MLGEAGQLPGKGTSVQILSSLCCWALGFETVSLPSGLCQTEQHSPDSEGSWGSGGGEDKRASHFPTQTFY